MIYQILLIVACFIIILLVFFISNLLRQIKQLESEVTAVTEIEERAFKVYQFMLKLFTETYANLQRVNKRGAFSSDDEVGFVFKIIVESIKQVKFQIENLVKKDEDDDDNVE